MRVVKEAAVRRNEILDAAEQLFVSKGFDATSTNDILEKVGIARGTLYYHFKSKEEILDAMISRLSDSLIQKAAVIAADQAVPVLERLTQMMLALNVDSELGAEIMEQVHKPQNALMHQKMQEGLIRGVVPLVSGLIEEGIEQGICQTEYPSEAAEMLLIYSNTAFDHLADDSRSQKKILAFIYHMERVLGMRAGSMLQVILPIFQKQPQN
ncbi:TetR/AcrR family transcriptional regulator [Erysipelotrichaceae bacterium RD49]|nr:TetR/AcrR family transcriptional regulator [Erysipelotrichaceae bacterium RD49]